MTHVKTAEFKSRLSHYLSLIRGGDELIITDRKTPIARVVPYSAGGERLAVLPARESPRALRKLKIPRARPGTDSLRALRDDRRDDLEAA
ncbi:MAG: hypothetical protein V2A66_08195 [Pseudomonadota bacterium]